MYYVIFLSKKVWLPMELVYYKNIVYYSFNVNSTEN